MATHDLNRQVIEEFRANAGTVGGNYEGRPLLLLTTTGRKTGRTHTTPVMYLADGKGYCVFASKGGAPEHLNPKRTPVINIIQDEDDWRP